MEQIAAIEAPSRSAEFRAGCPAEVELGRAEHDAVNPVFPAMNDAVRTLLTLAEDNGGGLEPRDVLGPVADRMETDQLIAALKENPGFAECLKAGLLEMKRDDGLTPSIYFVLSPSASERMGDLRDD